MRRALPWLAALALTTVPLTARADVTITSMVTPVGMEFRYDYSVMNTQMDNLVALSFAQPDIGSVRDVMGPTAFDITLVDAPDPNNPTFVNFIASGVGLAPGDTLSGFSYIAAAPPTTIQVQAFDAGNNAVAGTVFQGGTGILNATGVPEPGSLALLGTGLLALVPLRRRKIVA